MQNAISLLGSTGSIGRQTLEAAELLRIPVRALTADKNIGLLETQTRKFRPAVAAVYNEAFARDFKARVRDLDVRVVSGTEGLLEAARVPGADTVVTAVVGTAGLLPTLAAVELGRRVALANKETLVCAGELVMKRAGECGAQIIPVDSEHSAIFQCLIGGGRVRNIILTASGGPFLGYTKSELSRVTPELALRHPSWVMGRKVTIDSATLMNKGLEFIEAMHLFSAQPETIRVVIHPQSIVHSMVEFEDGCVIAQLSVPDMRLPIQYALTYPDRAPSLAEPLDFTRIASLTFAQPDLGAFPCLKLAMDTARVRGTACAVLSAADDMATELFLHGRIGFNQIYEFVADALDNINNIEDPSIDDIIAADGAAKRFVSERAK